MKFERTLPRPPAMSELAERNPLALFLDFDGTLVDIAPTPDSISVPPGLAGALERLAGDLAGRLAIVSGRSVADLARHLGPLALARAGSHGVERVDSRGRQIGEAPGLLPASARDSLRDFASGRDGLIFEDKRYGAALHFRGRPELEEDAVAHAGKVAGDAGMALKHGRCVVEVLHEVARKSAAVRAFMDQPPFRDATPVFVGDDLTDEDGFAAAEELGGFGILVGDRHDTLARYRLDSPAAVRAWLTL